MARFILLTGLIGSGKSYVAKMLRDKRYTVVDSDSFAKSLYHDPDLYKLVVERLGPKCLTDDGKIDLSFVRDYLLSTSPDDPLNFAWAVASRVANGISFKYDSSKEVIFVEAAPTRQVGQVCIWLGIKQAVVVRTDEELRRKRLKELRGLPDSTIDAFENLQSIDNVGRAVFPLVNPSGVETSVAMRDLWNLPGRDLNGDLMDILEKDIAPTPEEKFAMYERYLRESPAYCKQNAMCYSFYNLGGCNNCPFPCSQQDRNFERANREFMEEKKSAGQQPNASGAESKIKEDIDLTEHAVDEERAKFVEALAWTNISDIPETVRIGDQVWMNCNLQAPADPENGIFVVDGETYFTWDAAVREAKKYESLGFRLPTREDWEKLEKYCGADAGKKLKSTDGWNHDVGKYDGNGTDSVGFNGKPAGWYSPGDSRVRNGGYGGFFWSPTPYGTSGAYGRNLNSYGSGFDEGYYTRFNGFSVRLVKDSE